MFMGIVGFIIFLLQIYSYILLARVLLSWFPNLDRSNPTVDAIVRTLYSLTEPVLSPIRNALPPTAGIDWSPLIVFLGITILIRLLIAF
ncbi:MAG: YggT family protein [Chloroflexi bacterium]|nr:MAG: YggT family protein [Chloroflexota bacterium]